MTQTQAIRQSLPLLFWELKVRSLLDAPCGDFAWMCNLELDLQTYVGLDIVPDVIARNQCEYAAANRSFNVADITCDALPKVDLILCRDCLVHLPNDAIMAALKNFKQSGSTYLLATSYPGLGKKNKSITVGDWRSIDLCLPPFELPPPLRTLNEKCTEELDHPEKSLCLWQLADLYIA